jgi:hypothetical protein
MRHAVFWSPEADERLQSLILSSNNREHIVRVVREIDFWLARAPLDFGESREEPVRLAVIRPLAVLFEVLEEPPTVIVLDLWRF